jgi:hypothetical protein
VAVLSRGRSGGPGGAAATPRHGGAHHAGDLGGLAGGDAGRPHRWEAQIYLRDTWRIAYGIDAISMLFRRRKTKLNARATARPPAPPSRRHLKNELRATVSRLAVQRLFAMDGHGAEGPHARFGLKATHRRLWCPFGSRPPWTHEHQYHWSWLYAAVGSKQPCPTKDNDASSHPI